MDPEAVTASGLDAGVTRPQATIRSAISDATARLSEAGSESARLDAEVLLGHVLGVDRVSLSAYPEAVVGDGQLRAFRALVDRRVEGEPVAYIRELKEFHGLALHVDRRVLIPRPETETLVDAAIERITGILTSSRRDPESGRFRIWDVGTGSGAVAVALAVVLRRRRYDGAVRFHVSDVSSDALAVAIENAVSHGTADLMDFARGDLIGPEARPDAPVDLLVANLPYVPTEALPHLPIAASFEPRLALDGGDDGLDLIRRLLPGLPDVLATGGAALLEIGADQATLVEAAVTDLLPGWTCSIRADLGGSPRVVSVGRG
jgi:release factor glutamine methyltransferase